MVGPNKGITTLVSKIVRTVADEADEGFVSKSTEETISKIEEYNKSRNDLPKPKEKVIVFSMDIVKWYPEMVPESNAKTVRRMYEEGDIKFKGVEYEEVSKFLGDCLTREEIIEEGFEDILYIKEKKMETKNLKIEMKKK